MDPRKEHALLETRRQFFGRAATGIGTVALGSLLNPALLAGEPKEQLQGEPGLLRALHHAPTAKRVIYLFQNGAPTHTDLFD